MTTLNQHWDEYWTACHGKHPDVHPVQKLETRQAFFAGALALLSSLQTNLNNPSVDGDELIRVLDKHQDEIDQEFTVLLNRKHAN